ncbi:MAG TPA: GDSL-type esterase/lipase family protein, partial [Bryobacteraceae bacterium]|nr:GDSL-type esterase/lipase family protein [Bryobacteraceae bacterium]
MRTSISLLFLLTAAGALAGSTLKIVRQGDGYALLRNGQPYFVKGAAGAVHLEELAAAGGNSIRAGVTALDRAQALNLSVLVDLPFGKQRSGFNYEDPAAVNLQREELRAIVEQYKNHPAVLAWALGNELEIGTTAAQRVALWREIDAVARMIHDLDPNHPVITVVGGQYKQMLHELNQYCPSLDAVGLNSYAGMLTLPEDIRRQAWTRPYWVTEFGPRGHWQVPRTAWKLPIEDSSTEKAEFYRRAYEHAVQGRPQCLGSYVFHWAQHHEKTHTWYGMFLEDGSRTEAVDVMTYVWSGRWPANRSPRLGPAPIHIRSENGAAQGPAVLPPGALLDCDLDASDPDADALAYSWDLRLDVSGDPNVGGDREEPVPPIEGLMLGATGNRATFRLPEQEGDYRLFAYVRDGHGNAATANLPLRVEKTAFPAVAPDPNASHFGAGIQRTMTLLATSTPERRNTVRILFYGQSLTKQEWTGIVARQLRARFPYADITFANRAIGGYASNLLKRTLPHDVFAFYPDLIIFHDFGGEPDFEYMIEQIRSHTTAEILIQNDRPDALTVEPPPTDLQKLRGYQWMNRHNDEWLPALAARYSCEIVDVRRPFLDYLKAHHLKPADVLRDGAHFNFQGDYVIAELTGRHLRYDPALPRKPWEGLVRTYEIGRGIQWVNGRLELEFEGNRVDAIAGWADPYYGGEADVRIDGQRPSQRPELYHLTRPTDTFSVDWPGVNHIGAEKQLLIEDWTLKVLEVNADESRLRFEVAGSRTGPDGSGVSTERFVSRSGRVVIEPQDWTFARSFDLLHQPTPVGFEVTWRVVPMFVDVYRAPRLEDRTREQVTTLALGLAGTKHKLELVARGPNPPMIRAIRVYRPPFASLEKVN